MLSSNLIIHCQLFSLGILSLVFSKTTFWSTGGTGGAIGRFQINPWIHVWFWNNLQLWWSSHFKMSAAVAAQNDQRLQRMSYAENVLVQEVVHNFNTCISFPNLNLSKHSLAITMLQLWQEYKWGRRYSMAHTRILAAEDEDHITVNSMFQKNPLIPSV